MKCWKATTVQINRGKETLHSNILLLVLTFFQ